MPLELITQEPVPSYVHREAEQLIQFAESEIEHLRYQVPIYITPAYSFFHDPGNGAEPGFNFGLFEAVGRKPRIIVCGLPTGENRYRKLRSFNRVLLHELAHFEQWRDGLALDESPANKRAATLLEKYERQRQRNRGRRRKRE